MLDNDDRDARDKLISAAENYYIAHHTDPLVLAAIVSGFLQGGWTLHGPLILQAVADPASPTMVSLFYFQAVTKDTMSVN
jgi:hypothetical protein